MKTKNHMLSVLLAIFVMVTVNTVNAQSTRVYTKGHVFALSMIKTNPGMTDDYIATLKNTVKAMDDEGMKEGLLLSYKIFIGGSANENDWDILILEEYTDMNTMANNDDKWDTAESCGQRCVYETNYD
jgi:hypothetical protein